MTATVRYYSRSGNTKLVADAIAKAAGATEYSVDNAKAPITKPVDVLFIGGALYAYGIDKQLKEYLAGLDPKMVKKAVVFSTSWMSKHAIDLIKDGLKAKGIPVEEKYLYFRGKPGAAQLREAAEFARSFV